MAENPALPLWTDAYLADTHPLLSLEEHGCYLLLMQFAWRSPKCRLPDDDAMLARMLGVSLNRWKKKLRPVMERYWVVENGFISQKRLSKEQNYVTHRREVGRINGTKGGRPKPLITNDPDKPRGSDLVKGLDNQIETDSKPPTPTPTPTPLSKNKRPNGLSSERKFPTHDDLEFAIDEWNELAGDCGLPKAKLTNNRIPRLKARLSEAGSRDAWIDALKKVATSPFLRGEKTEWRADLDFVLQAKSFTRLIEGSYDEQIQRDEPERPRNQREGANILRGNFPR